MIPLTVGWVQQFAQTNEMSFLAWAATSLLACSVALLGLVGRMVWRRLDHMQNDVHIIRREVTEAIGTLETKAEERHERLMAQVNALMSKAQAALSYAQLSEETPQARTPRRP